MIQRISILAVVTFATAAVWFVVQPVGLEIRLTENRAHAETGAHFWQDGDGSSASMRPESLADLAEKLSPSVVNIKIERKSHGGELGGPEEFLEEFFRKPGKREHPKPRPRRSISSGSGFVISPDGYIVTNNHVVENADKVIVAFRDGKEATATIIGLDPKTDIALIKVDVPKKLTAAALGDSQTVRVGDSVMAIGNPFGLDHTVTVGILSAKGRSSFGGHQIAGPYDDFLQTDASINPGNSGGPLIDMKGRVVGINTAIAAAGQGIGFAIPINMTKSLLPQLRETGSVTRGWLGVQIQRVDEPMALAFGLEEPEGALVGQVFENSPAEKAKLKRGDVIIEFNDSKIKDFNDLPRIVASTPPGSAVGVVVQREGKRTKLTAVLEKMENDEVQLASAESPASKWGFEVQKITPQVAEELGLDESDGGVAVTEVDPNSESGRAGLRPGDVIIEANREPVRTPAGLEEALEDAREHAVLLVQRGATTLYLAVKRDE
ncbi:MAG: DegQ family serine endoprotease [bacterium]|nr:DegQ family serine endoprotease [bacterium]